MILGAVLVIAGCAINYIPVRAHPRVKDAVSLTLAILSLLGCWFGFSLIVGPSLIHGWEQPLLFVTGLLLLGWSFRIIIRSLQMGKVIPLIAGFFVIIPATNWIKLGFPAVAEAWISFAYGFTSLIASYGINHIVRLLLGYTKTKRIYILHIVYGIVWIGLAAAGAAYVATQSDLYLNIAGTLIAVGVGYFLFIKGYHLYQDFKKPKMTEEERERIPLGFIREGN